MKGIAPAESAAPPTTHKALVLDHTAALGGAEIALTRLLPAVDKRYATSVLLFADGPLRESLEALGIAVELLELDSELADRGRARLLGGPVGALRTAAESLRFTGRLAAAVRKSCPDFVVANSLKSAVLAAVAAQRVKVPWVWHLHDRLSRDYLPRIVAPALRSMARLPRQVVVNSRETASHLARLSADRVSVAYPGLPPDSFVRRTTTPPQPRLGILGRISSTKGQREFLQAAARIVKCHPEVSFRVIGTAMFNDHAYAEEVRALPPLLGLGDRVTFTGWTPNPVAELDDLTAVVHASPVPEPFGQVIVEAMARGVPVVATRGGGATEILDPLMKSRNPGWGNAMRTDFGQLVNPGDIDGLANAMSWILDHPDAADRLADQAFASAAQRFSIAETAATVAAAWDHAITAERRFSMEPPVVVHTKTW